MNPVLDTNPGGWTRFNAPTYSGENKYILYGNYWGTENDILINKMIIDDDDYTGLLGNIVETPILTLSSPELREIYPFVTAIWLTEVGGTTPITEAAPGSTYEVHVSYNRDMAEDIQPMITYGGADPYTDYTVHFDRWESPTEWVGTTKISSVATEGTMIFRAKGGAAADDRWLVCGEDELRFCFDVVNTSAQSVVLNAAGGIRKIDLMWAQNEYDLLAGYNLYRTTEAGVAFTAGGSNPKYTKINDAILTGNTYTDDDVQPGVTYYYVFTIVDTDGNEIAGSESNIASAAPIDDEDPTITHTPVSQASVGQNITISATAADNIAVASVKLFYRTKGAASYSSKSLVYNEVTGLYTGFIPASAVTADGVQYYLIVTDTYGNYAMSGSANAPYYINADSTPTLLVAFPNSVVAADAADTAITVYGTHFTSDMTLTLGTAAITDFTVSAAGDTVSFTAPALPMGSYSVAVTAGGKSVTLANAVTYTDPGSYVQINSDTVLSGSACTLPLYVGVTGALTAFHAEITVPTSDFSAASVILAEGVSGVTLDSNYSGGKLIISMASASDFNPGENPLVNIVLTPRPVTNETNTQITLTSGKLNGAEIVKKPTNTSVTVYPNFSLNAIVNYFTGAAPVSGVKITAASGSALTDGEGKASVTGINRSDVTVLASKTDYIYEDVIGAWDAVLVLKQCVGKETLDASQLIAGDVNGDGTVDEVDASMILQFSVGLIDAFPSGAWHFTPAYQAKTLTSDVSTVTFTAILTGDVDGSWAEA